MFLCLWLSYSNRGIENKMNIIFEWKVNLLLGTRIDSYSLFNLIIYTPAFHIELITKYHFAYGELPPVVDVKY